MKHKPIKNRCCLNKKCTNLGKFGEGNIIRHSMYKTKHGRRRRFLCKTCKKTFSSTKGTPYYRLHKSRAEFDEVAQMTVEGTGISSISRIKHFSWNTIARWQFLASQFACKFNDKMLKNIDLKELQLDEIQSFVGKRKNQIWIFAAIEVWSRLWISHLMGNRNYRNIINLVNDVVTRCFLKSPFLFTTDGFEPYAWAAKRIFGSACIFAQVIKKRRKNRVIQVTRKLIIGRKIKLKQLLFESEDSSTINTSFIERLNLTIRQGCAYLGRRTACHARYRCLLREVLLLDKKFHIN
jgi:IS1 family transposase